ncbi:DUF3267 domain-containing protein, partial [Staphylococcus aureus]|nr:DUF3267 domain-containing protein [Staphylococcus aureus]
MHKIDLTTNNFQMRRFIILQLVIALFVILFTYKWALGVTAVVDQNIIINLVYGFAGFIILLILHELIHRALFLLIKVFGYSSLIFMFSMHTAYCFIDILLVALTISS